VASAIWRPVEKKYRQACHAVQLQIATLLSIITLLEEKVLYRTLKGSISATYLEPLKGSIHS